MKLREGVRTSGRPYRMVARAEAAAATRERILDAAVAAFWASPATEVPLDRVAAEAGVSVQTVIRHFGTKDGLFEAASKREAARVHEQRDEAPVDDVTGAVRVLVDHYEEMGERVLKMLAEEDRAPGLREVIESGRREHRSWCERVFPAALAGRKGVERERRLAQLVSVCDVYTWKLLRKDSGLSRRQTELALIELLQPLMEVKR